MIVDLKVALLTAALLLVVAFLLGAWWGRRRAASGEIEAAPIGTLLLDGDQYCEANDEARRLLGLPRAEGLLPEAAWRAALREDTAQIGAGAIQRLLKVDAERHVRWRLVPRPDGRARLFLTDQSDQRRAELAATRFLSSLSHELRTPLTAILAHVELLRVGGELDEPRRTSVAFIHREAERIVRLIAGLLDLGRLSGATELELRAVDPLIVAEEAIGMVILVAEERQVEIELIAASPQPRVLADPDRLTQVFLNLLDNAVKYARPGDRVVVELTPRHDRVACTVRDSGPGIPPEHLAHVRERLYRGRTDVEGSGLGLALVDEILRLHRGELEIESHEDAATTGTTVRFALPIAPGSALPRRVSGEEVA